MKGTQGLSCFVITSTISMPNIFFIISTNVDGIYWDKLQSSTKGKPN